MWKKEEGNTPTTDVQREPIPRPDPIATRSPVSSGDRATIGRSIAIRGDVTGDEDLVIQGRIEGSVNLQQHSVTVGPEGEVKASVVGKVVTVEGVVEGDIQGEEQVILRSSARVQGDIVAPRVVLEDGARFRGGIDMGDVTERARASGSRQEARAGGDGGKSAAGTTGSTGSSGTTGSSATPAPGGAGKVSVPSEATAEARG